MKNCFRKAGWKKNDEKNGNFSLDDEKDEIPLAILRSRLQLPESMTFEDYVNIDSNVQTDEEMTETEIVAELQRGLMPDLEAGEEEEKVEEVSAIEPNVCSLVDAKHHLQEVRRYLEFCSFTSDVEFSIMSQLETSLMINVSQRQPSIRDFFH